MPQRWKGGWHGRRDAGDSDYRHRGKVDQGMGGLMTKIPKKTTGWAAAYSTNGQIHLIFVSAPNKKVAIKKLKKMDCRVLDKDQVQHVIVITFPGPLEVQQLPESDWEEKSREIEVMNV